MKREGLRSIEAEREAENKWGEDVRTFANASLLPDTDSWYMGTNIPGKPRECLIYLGGVPNYSKALQECANGAYTGFKRA